MRLWGVNLLVIFLVVASIGAYAQDESTLYSIFGNLVDVMKSFFYGEVKEKIVSNEQIAWKTDEMDRTQIVNGDMSNIDVDSQKVAYEDIKKLVNESLGVEPSEIKNVEINGKYFFLARGVIERRVSGVLAEELYEVVVEPNLRISSVKILSNIKTKEPSFSKAWKKKRGINEEVQTGEPSSAIEPELTVQAELGSSSQDTFQNIGQFLESAEANNENQTSNLSVENNENGTLDFENYFDSINTTNDSSIPEPIIINTSLVEINLDETGQGNLV